MKYDTQLIQQFLWTQ